MKIQPIRSADGSVPKKVFISPSASDESALADADWLHKLCPEHLKMCQALERLILVRGPQCNEHILATWVDLVLATIHGQVPWHHLRPSCPDMAFVVSSSDGEAHRQEAHVHVTEAGSRGAEVLWCYASTHASRMLRRCRLGFLAGHASCDAASFRGNALRLVHSRGFPEIEVPFLGGDSLLFGV